MGRKAITDLMIELKRILEKEDVLSIKQLSEKTKTQWRTAEKALNTMKKLGVLEERINHFGRRIERSFSINPKLE